MRYYPKSAKGFKVDMLVAEKLGLLDEWEEWDGEQYDSDFAYAFEDKWSVTPERVVKFEDTRGGEITGLSGFQNGETYVLFEKNEKGPHWKALRDALKQNDIPLEEGTWSQLG
jgi:hypothetical protein